MKIINMSALNKLAFVMSICLGSSVAQAQQALSADDVEQIVKQSVSQALAQGSPATIAVVDRVGNVLGVFEMTGATATTVITSGNPAAGGLEGLAVPSALAAISKAVTAAYLSSNGNAFSTRTANQIIQEHFNPGEFNQPGGPLFGVQFSQLQCSDLINNGGTAGPKPAPLGLAADPGGLPLYKAGSAVGGIGVMADGIYGIDRAISDTDKDIDETIALAGTAGFEPPDSIVADRITVDGKTLRFSDAKVSDLAQDTGGAADDGPLPVDDSSPLGGNAPVDDDPPAEGTEEDIGAETDTAGSFVGVPGFTSGTVTGGTAFGTAASGFVPSGSFGVPAFVLGGRFAPRPGSDGADALTAGEVHSLISNALSVASRARAQIRNPPSSNARVTVSVVDTNGNVLGVARSPDAPVFGTDVSLQKARTAAFFSRTDAGARLQSAGLGHYVAAAQAFGLPTALSDGIAFSDRAGGNLSRPFFPDGIDGNPNGPFSRPIGAWSVFNTGLQFDIVAGSLTSAGSSCSGISRNGIQIFPGSVPIYRGSKLVGGIGVSGDGIDQDDMISFLGVHEAGLQTGTINNADPAIRADTLTPQGVRLRYVNCPQAPLSGSSEAKPCEGK